MMRARLPPAFQRTQVGFEPDERIRVRVLACGSTQEERMKTLSIGKSTYDEITDAIGGGRVTPRVRAKVLGRLKELGK